MYIVLLCQTEMQTLDDNRNKMKGTKVPNLAAVSKLFVNTMPD